MHFELFIIIATFVANNEGLATHNFGKRIAATTRTA